MAVLNRMAEGIHKQIEIRRGDTIIMSSSPIPGNEGSVSKIQNKLTMRGAKVIHNKTMDVHTSGHGYAEELKLMLNLLKPKFLMPVHGENKHLTAHAQLAMEMGMSDRNIIIAENGSAIEVDQTVCKIVGKVQAGDILIDGLGIGDIGSVVLNDRKAMANAGVFMVSLIIDGKTGVLKVQPEIISRGFVFQKTSDKLIDDSKKMIKDFILKNVDMLIDIQQEKNFQKKFRDHISEYLYEVTGRKPVVLALVTRI
jgi:ribonuclease J